MKLNQVVDLRLTNYKAGNIRNGEYLRVLSWDIKVFLALWDPREYSEKSEINDWFRLLF